MRQLHIRRPRSAIGGKSEHEKENLFPTKSLSLVIKNVLLASGYPGAKDAEEHQRIIQAIHRTSIDLFVNLFREEDQRGFTPYEQQIRQLARQGSSRFAVSRCFDHCKSLEDREVEFLSFPIPDQSVCRDEEKVLKFCLHVSKRIRDDHRKVLVHCW